MIEVVEQGVPTNRGLDCGVHTIINCEKFLSVLARETVSRFQMSCVDFTSIVPVDRKRQFIKVLMENNGNEEVALEVLNEESSDSDEPYLEHMETYGTPCLNTLKALSTSMEVCVFIYIFIAIEYNVLYRRVLCRRTNIVGINEDATLSYENGKGQRREGRQTSREISNEPISRC